MQDLEYIKKFQKINLTNITKKLNINRSNLYANRMSDKKLHLIRQEIESEIAELYIMKGKKGKK